MEKCRVPDRVKRGVERYLRKVTALGSFFPGGVWLFYGVSPATLSPKDEGVLQVRLRQAGVVVTLGATLL